MDKHELGKQRIQQIGCVGFLSCGGAIITFKQVIEEMSATAS